LNLFDADKFADITIKTADGKEIKASKNILSRSPVFDAMLNSHDMKEAQEGVIEINDIDHDDMSEMIRYMYTDQVPKLKEIAVGLMIAANKYNLPGLFKICTGYLKANLSIENLVDVFIHADALELEDLEMAAIEFMISNSDEVFESAKWKELKTNNLSFAAKILERVIKVKG
jgi:hypothetical protein